MHFRASLMQKNSCTHTHKFIIFTCSFLNTIKSYLSLIMQFSIITPRFIVIQNYCDPNALPAAPSQASPLTNFSTVLGAVATYTCALGYSGAPNASCQLNNSSSGVWSTVVGGCSCKPGYFLVMHWCLYSYKYKYCILRRPVVQKTGWALPQVSKNLGCTNDKNKDITVAFEKLGDGHVHLVPIPPVAYDCIG